MVNAGRILIIPKGDWSNLVSYDMLDLVSYNSVAYIARQASVGVNPSTDTQMTYWQPFGSVSDIATTTTPGLVMPDGDTIKIGTGGLIYVDLDADDIDYSNTSSGLSATDVQAAIDEAAALAKLAVDGIAPVETSSTASQAYAQGDYFLYNGKLYICTLAFAQGAMIIPGTNCSQTTIAAQLSSLSSAIANKEDAPTVLTQTLAASATTLTFTDASIGNNSRIRAYSDPFVLGLITDMTQSGTSVTLTCAAQASSVSVKLEVRN